MKNKNKKKIPIILAFILATSIFGIFVAKARAQSAAESSLPAQGGVLATVSLDFVKIASQNGNDFKLSFFLSNGKMSQSGIRYGVRLVKGADSSAAVWDEKVFSEEVNMSENESLPKNIEYQAPAYLSGTFDLQLLSRSSSGLVFAISDLGEVKLTGNNQSVQIDPAACYLTTGKDQNAKFTLYRGVDVASDESLILNCQAVNNLGKDVDLTSDMKSYRRSLYGDLVDTSTVSNNKIHLAKGAKQFISIPIAKAPKAQAYDARVVLLAGGQEVSNPVIFHYVVRGDGATIQNLRFDKNYYLSGDIARVSFVWSPAADTFSGSRTGQGTRSEGESLDVIVKDGQGANCSQIQNKTLDFLKRNIEMNVSITADCINPVFSATIKDKTGVLDSKSFAITSPKDIKLKTSAKEAANPAVSMAGRAAFWGKIVVLIVVLIVLLVLIASFIRRRNRDTRFYVWLLMMIAGSFFSLILAPGVARASTSVGCNTSFFVDSVITCPASQCAPSGWVNDVQQQYLANLDSCNYAQGATMGATGMMTMDLTCGNLGADVHSFRLDGTINGSTKTFFGQTYSPYDTVSEKLSYNFPQTFIAPGSTGPANALFDGYFTAYLSYFGIMGTEGHYQASIPYTVAPNSRPTAHIVAPAEGSVFNFGDPITLSGTGTDSDGSIVEYKWWDWKHRGGQVTVLYDSNVSGSYTSTTLPDMTAISSSPIRNLTFMVGDNGGLWGSQDLNITIGPTATLECSRDGVNWVAYCNNTDAAPQNIYWRVSINNNEGGTMEGTFYCNNAAGATLPIPALTSAAAPYAFLGQYCTYDSQGSYAPQVVITKRNGVAVSNPKATVTNSLVLGSISCQGANPPTSNSELCVVDGVSDDAGLSDGTSNLQRRLVQTCSTSDDITNKCEYKCSDGYIKNGSACEASAAPSCVGPNPPDVDSLLCTGDGTGLDGTSNTARRLVQTCSAADDKINKCEYVCNANATYDNSTGKCVRNATKKDWTENAP